MTFFVFHVLLLVQHPDDDGDGLSDAYEISAQSSTTTAVTCLDPLNPDSDGDGVNDGNDPFPCDASESEDCDGDDKEGDLLSTVIFGQEAQKLRANSKMERIPLFWKLLPPLMMMMVKDAKSK